MMNLDHTSRAQCHLLCLFIISVLGLRQSPPAFFTVKRTLIGSSIASQAEMLLDGAGQALNRLSFPASFAKARPLARIGTGTDTLRPGPRSPAALRTASGANVHGEQRPRDPATLAVALAASPRGDVSQATCTVKALSDVAGNTDAHMHAAHSAIWGSFPLHIENSCGRSFHVPRRARRRNAGASGPARSTRRQITGEGGHAAP